MVKRILWTIFPCKLDNLDEMDKFLVETENLDKPVTRDWISNQKHTKKIPEPDGFTSKFSQIFKK